MRAARDSAFRKGLEVVAVGLFFFYFFCCTCIHLSFRDPSTRAAVPKFCSSWDQEGFHDFMPSRLIFMEYEVTWQKLDPERCN